MGLSVFDWFEVAVKFRQTTSRVLMIRPVSFGPNPETMATNAFQGKPIGDPVQIQKAALAGFDAMVDRLRQFGVDVFVYQDTHDPPTPDAIFPNNWFSTHSEGTVVLYPMQPESRRGERRPDLFASLAEDHWFQIGRFVDFTDGECSGLFLEGTGSLVLDHLGQVGYAALSARTRAPILEKFGGALEFDIETFRATDRGVPIYHTNVMLSLGRTFAVLADETIDDPDERDRVMSRIRAGGRRIIRITREQCRSYAGNILEVQSREGDPLIVMSTTAWGSLDQRTQAKLSEHGTVVTVHIPTIEQFGGGSARCMIAELFLPKFTGQPEGYIHDRRSIDGVPRRG